MRSQAKDMQSQLAEESVTESSSGVSITMDGNLKVTAINIDDDLMVLDKKDKLEQAIMSAHDSVSKKIQRVMAMKMKKMGGMPDMPGLN